MKKLLTAILLVTVMLTVMVLPASAAGGNLSATASLSSDKTSFTVNLVVNDNPGVIAMTAKLSYDSKALKLVSTKNGSIFENVTMESQNKTDNPYNIIWMEATAAENIKTNGVLASYTFQVLKNAPVGQTEIKFDISDAVDTSNSNIIKFNGCSFKVNVKGTENSQTTTPSQGQDVSQSTASQNTGVSNNGDSGNVITNDQTLDVEKPEFDTTLPEETESAEETASALEEITLEEAESSETETKADGKTEKDNTLVIIIAIAAIVVLGVGITVVALCFGKKSKNKQ